MEVKRYIARVKHDNEIIEIKTLATCLESAKTNICNAENCPESAIITIREDLKHYLVWFVQNSERKYFIEAKSRNEARQIFANMHNVIVSDYIKARLVY